MTSDPRLLRWLAARGGRASRRGTLWTLVVLLAQIVVALSAIGAGAQPRAVEPPMTLAAQVIVQPPLGLEPGAIDARERWPIGSRVQVSFQGEQDGWTAVLWLSGDTVASLYPNPARGQSGWTGTGTYAVPGEQQWLRLSPTPPGGDEVVVVTAWEPVPEVQRALDDPSPTNVRALRRFLDSRRSAWHPGGAAVERFLPTADGRALPVEWRARRGAAPLVATWTIRSAEGI